MGCDIASTSADESARSKTRRSLMAPTRSPLLPMPSTTFAPFAVLSEKGALFDTSAPSTKSEAAWMPSSV